MMRMVDSLGVCLYFAEEKPKSLHFISSYFAVLLHHLQLSLLLSCLDLGLLQDKNILFSSKRLAGL